MSNTQADRLPDAFRQELLAFEQREKEFRKKLKKERAEQLKIKLDVSN